MPRVIITGDRSWNCLKLASHIVQRLLASHGGSLVIVHGGASGVDQSFEDACKELGVQTEVHPANWTLYGKSAGPIRNQKMVALGADHVIAVHRNLDKSRGTLDCIRRAIKTGIPVYLISENPRPGMPVNVRRINDKVRL